MFRVSRVALFLVLWFGSNNFYIQSRLLCSVLLRASGFLQVELRA